MSERYTRLFALPGCLCSHSAPAAILAGALLKDNETGEILAQLKLKNVQAKPIKALTISLQALDTAGQKLGSPVPYHYLDLSIPQDGEFGQKDAIVLPHVAARGFQPKVTQVIFSDGTLWETGGEAWESIPPQVTLEKALGDEALCKEYRARFPSAAYLPQKDGPFWRCACGAWSREGDEYCHGCGASAQALFSTDLGEMRTSVQIRQKQIIGPQRKARAFSLFVGVLMVLCSLGLLLVNDGTLIRNRSYNAAYTQLFYSLVFTLITGVLWLICGALPGFSRKLMQLDAGLSFCCGLFLLYVLAFPLGARTGAPDLLLVMTLLFLIAVFLLYYFTFHIFKKSNSKGE